MLREYWSVQPANFSMQYKYSALTYQFICIVYVEIHMKNRLDKEFVQYYLSFRSTKDKEV